MTDYPDGHGPETCNYSKCDSESDVPCPFVRDYRPNDPLELSVKYAATSMPLHNHSWSLASHREWTEFAFDQTFVWQSVWLCHCGDWKEQHHRNDQRQE